MNCKLEIIKLPQPYMDVGLSLKSSTGFETKIWFQRKSSSSEMPIKLSFLG